MVYRIVVVSIWRSEQCPVDSCCSPHLCVGFLFLILYPASASLFHTQLSHTPSFTHNFVTHTIFLCHTPSFFVTHHLSHTTLSHTQLFLLLDPPPPPLSFLPSPSPLPATTFICWSLLEEVDLWGYPVR